jgi:3-hydroxymyristoyl/3-hydroxydecanoyl-(acyl carrier protein) dehydratase
MLESSYEYTIAADHPCFAGHFPDNPIIPGVIILEYLQLDFKRTHVNQWINTLITVKFSQPLYPEQPFNFKITPFENNKFKFIGQSNHQKIIQGFFIAEKL